MTHRWLQAASFFMLATGLLFSGCQSRTVEADKGSLLQRHAERLGQTGRMDEPKPEAEAPPALSPFSEELWAPVIEAWESLKGTPDFSDMDVIAIVPDEPIE